MVDGKKCPNMVGCRLFPRFAGSPTLRVLQTMYCESDFMRCERFVLRKAQKAVPDDLLPNGRRLGADGRLTRSEPRRSG